MGQTIFFAENYLLLLECETADTCCRNTCRIFGDKVNYIKPAGPIHTAVFTTRSVDSLLCPQPDALSTTRCFHGPMCPQPSVSTYTVPEKNTFLHVCIPMDVCCVCVEEGGGEGGPGVHQKSLRFSVGTLLVCYTGLQQHRDNNNDNRSSAVPVQ